jgi:uncharacterized protein (TIGR02145 family)
MDQQDAETQGWRGTSEGGMLKETLPGFWNEPNTGATNSSGFSAIPGGDRSPSGGFTLKGVYAYFWTATGTDAGNAWYRSLGNEFTTVYAYPYEKPFGFSIRCVKDR